VARYPGSIATNADLLSAGNRAGTTLAAALPADAVEIEVASTALFPEAGVVTIDDERIKYESKTATKFLSCTRGFDSSAAAAHASGATVEGRVVAAHHNLLRDEIVALETELGASPSGTYDTVVDRLDGVDAALSGKSDLGHTHAESDIVPDIDSRATRFIVTNPYVVRSGSYKGQLHCHSINSDGADSPTAVVTAYKNAGYDFISITDHNYLTTDPGVSGILYIQGVEQSVTGCRYHMTQSWAASVKTADGQPLIDELLDDDAIVTVCHPNWASLPLAQTLMDRLDGLHAVEIYNQNVGPNSNAEDKWDLLLTEGMKILGIAVDDCHDVSGATFNKGWIVVFADSLTSANVREAVDKGNFYATTGPTLSIIQSGNTLTVTTGESATIEWIGKSGTILRTAAGATSDSYTIMGDELYVRIRITRDSDSKKAWSNPIWVDLLGTAVLKGGGQVRGNLYVNKTADGYGADVYVDNKRLPVRECLSAARTYYVRTDGSDDNDGSANDAAHAWKTIQHAVNYVADNIDLNGYDATIQVGDGTYSEAVEIAADPPGRGYVYIQGNASDHNAVIVSSTNAIGTLYIRYSQKWRIKYVKLTASGSSNIRAGMYISSRATVSIYGVNFGTCGTAHMYVSTYGHLSLAEAYEISGNADNVFVLREIARVAAGVGTTFSGSITISGAFANLQKECILNLIGASWTGSFTGKRYSVDYCSILDTGGQSATWIPGSVAGTTSNSGYYM
jgi:hypothetical protein